MLEALPWQPNTFPNYLDLQYKFKITKKFSSSKGLFFLENFGLL